jgi:hypothetical protein
MPHDPVADLRRSYPKRDLSGLDRARATPRAIAATWAAFLIVGAVASLVGAGQATPSHAFTAPPGARIPTHSAEAFCARQAASLVECRRFEPAAERDADF